MREVNAVELRRSLARLAKELASDNQPVLLKLGKEPVGVIISIRDFNERFSLAERRIERQRLAEEILSDRVKGGPQVDEILRELRDT